MTFRDGDDFTRLDPVIDDRPTVRSPGRGVPLQWCALLLVITLVLAGLAVAAQHYRSRMITTTRVVSSGGFATVDLTGCPIGTECNYGQPGGQLLALIEVHFPSADQLSASLVFDVDTATNYRSTTSVRVTGGITILVTAQCVPRGSAVTGWRSAIPAAGPADVTIVAPGAVRGCSVAVSAHVPAGVAVPARALTALAAEPGLSST